MRDFQCIQQFLQIQRTFRDVGNHFDIFFCRQIRYQIIELENESHIVFSVISKLIFRKGCYSSAVHFQDAFIQVIKSPQNIEKRTLSRSTRSQDHADLTFFQLKGQPV